MSDLRYVRELTRAVQRLVEQGVTDPSAEQIAGEHYGDRAIPGVVIEDVRRKLRAIRDQLERPVYGANNVTPLSEAYYALYRHEPELTAEQLVACLPGLRSGREEGLLLLSAAELDPRGAALWRHWQDIQARQAEGKYERVCERVDVAVAAGRIEPADPVVKLARTVPAAPRPALPSAELGEGQPWEPPEL